jgi:hypothetical protein
MKIREREEEEEEKEEKEEEEKKKRGILSVAGYQLASYTAQ